jgi:hypothetical protein
VGEKVSPRAFDQRQLSLLCRFSILARGFPGGLCRLRATRAKPLRRDTELPAPEPDGDVSAGKHWQALAGSGSSWFRKSP